MQQAAAARPLFPPRDHALLKALACERVAETGEPISRQSLADLTSRAQRTLNRPISRSTVWRILDEDAIKPWQYKYWIFPRDPKFLEKAGPILDLYAGQWEGPPPEKPGFHPQCRREDKHSGASSRTSTAGTRPWATSPSRKRI